jgi:hypothetical protein
MERSEPGKHLPSSTRQSADFASDVAVDQRVSSGQPNVSASGSHNSKTIFELSSDTHSAASSPNWLTRTPTNDYSCLSVST